jgi:hypothetical protein
MRPEEIENPVDSVGSYNVRVAVIDIGKPGKSLAWAIDDPNEEGSDLDECIEALATALAEGAVALGFEAPQFVPVRDDPMKLTAARSGESGPGLPTRPFSAGAGATVLVTSVVIVPYVLRRLRERTSGTTVTLDWRRPINKPGHLLLFEAFVADQRKTTATRHVEDAKLAIADFRSGMTHPASFESSVTSPECLSLLGAALLRTGWSSDLALLSTPCLVVRSKSRG